MIEVASQLPQLITQGIATGAIYGLVALGLVLNYKAPEVLNFGRDDIGVLSASIAWGLIVGAGRPSGWSFPALAQVGRRGTN